MSKSIEINCCYSSVQLSFIRKGWSFFDSSIKDMIDLVVSKDKFSVGGHKIIIVEKRGGVKLDHLRGGLSGGGDLGSLLPVGEVFFLFSS